MLYLLPPSEGKLSGGSPGQLPDFPYELPINIAQSASPKDLKCKDKRYEEAMQLNSNVLDTSAVLPAIHRYNGVMFKAIEYQGLSNVGQEFFNTHYGILSGLWGFVLPQDTISNYKLPIDTKGLYAFWGDSITHRILSYCQTQHYDTVVDLLPGSYKKAINRQLLGEHLQIVQVDFFHTRDSTRKKMTHGVKKVKGEWIHNVCEQGIDSTDMLLAFKSEADCTYTLGS